MQQAVCVRRKRKDRQKKHEKIRPTQNTPPNPQQPGDRDHLETAWGVTATTSRRRVTRHAPRLSPYSPAFKDPEFVEIGFVQLSQSVKIESYTYTHGQTDRLIK